MRTLADSECVMGHAGTIQSPREDVGPVPDKLSKMSNNNKEPGAMAAARAGRETGNSLPNVRGSKPHRRIRYMVPATGFGTGEPVAVERSESRNLLSCGREPVCPARCSASCAPAPRLLGLAVRRIGSVAFRHWRCAGAMPAQKMKMRHWGGTPCSRYSIDAPG